jgi:hypothetical protein
MNVKPTRVHMSMEPQLLFVSILVALSWLLFYFSLNLVGILFKSFALVG